MNKSFGGLTALALTVGTLYFAKPYLQPNTAQAFVTPPPPEKTWLLQDEKNTIDVFNKAADSVVFVETKASVRDFFSREAYEVPSGAGTGFIWDKGGYVVTNWHVIENASKKTASVRLRDGRSIDAKVIGYDSRKDVALLKLNDTKDLPEGFASRLADSGELQVGQKTLAIGNPFELSHTLTTGVVSAVNRTVPAPDGRSTNRDMIQTDAAINPGNSGGPLMDSRGYLIGMNSVIYSRSGSSAGVGFAVPSNSIKRIITQLIKTGKVSHPGLGISAIPDSITRQLDVEGVFIWQVVPDSGAQKAGLRGTRRKGNGDPEFGDRIVAVDGQKVESFDDLPSILENKNVGDKVKVDYYRGTKKDTATVTLSNVGE